MDYPYYIIIDQNDAPIELPKYKLGTDERIKFGERMYQKILSYWLSAFYTPDLARAYMKAAGYTDEQLKDYRCLRSIGVCPRCGSPVFMSLIPSQDGEDGYEYTSQCFYCGEDFYSFENPVEETCELPKIVSLGEKVVYKPGDLVFLDPADAEPVEISAVYDAAGDGEWKTPLEDGFTIITGYLGADWRIYKNAEGKYAAVAYSAGPQA